MELDRLKLLLTHIDSPRPRFWSHQQILSEHTLWGSPTAAVYLGRESTDFFPGRVDPTRILMIGEADEDSPIALDYRTDNPRVVYAGGVGPQLYWIELASNYEALIDILQDRERTGNGDADRGTGNGDAASFPGPPPS